MHTESLHELLSLIANRAYLICHWNQLRIFLTDAYLQSVRVGAQFPHHKDCCEVLWCDRAGKSSGVSDRSMKQSEIVSYLTQEPDHPTAYYLSPLHMDERQFGFAALSFGRMPYCYQPEYCLFISYLCLALEHLERYGTHNTSREKSIDNPQLYRHLMQIREEIQQHPESDWSVQELCQRTHVSRSYLQRMYKSYFGKSIFEDLIDFRIQRAKELLYSSDYTISLIAELCGYASYTHFANQFKAQEGITPSAYRERSRKK